MTEQLRAVAIGPDRVDIVVGHGTNEELAAWYYAEVSLHEDERTDYSVSEFPLDKKLEWEDAGEKTLRELVSDCTEFPVIAGWED
ncbi:hypothetical protein [Paenibacillus daejeonensis]|uniref:hypothetical protein n=1 Tax=Paenibacillus daejeonensis TaxID=135193 RepID=UPI0003758367|nr:hypothetical protein [Paenibacillus daejeonensis]